MTPMNETTTGVVDTKKRSAPTKRPTRTTLGTARVDRHAADPRAVAALVDSAVAQGFPRTIDDPAVLARFGVLLGRVESTVAA